MVSEGLAVAGSRRNRPLAQMFTRKSWGDNMKNIKHLLFIASAVGSLGFLAATMAPVQTTAAQDDVGPEIQVSSDGVSVVFFAHAKRNLLSFNVRVVGPDRYVFEDRIEEAATLEWVPPADLADGMYKWEARVVSANPDASLRNLPEGTNPDIKIEHFFASEDQQTHVASGSFQVEGGVIQGAEDQDIEDPGASRTHRVAAAVLDFLVPPARADLTIHTDGHVSVGTTANLAQFGIRTASDSGDTPFRVQVEGASTKFIVNDNGGVGVGGFFTSPPTDGLEVSGDTQLNSGLTVSDDVGIGTTSPVRQLHVSSSSTQLRLERTGSFANEWDFLASSSWLRVRESGVNFNPFQIDTGAPNASLVITGNGGIGMGTEAPASALHVQRANNSAQVLVQDSGTGSPQQMFRLINNGFPAFNLQDESQADVSWTFRLSGTQDDDERFTITKLGTGGPELSLFHNGDMEIAGAFLESSSRAVKDNIVEVDTETVLARLDSLPVHEWSYKSDLDKRHVGPMAEDFHEVFGLGPNGRSISPTDVAGVALSAVQGLKERDEVKAARIAELEKANARLKSRLERLEDLLLSGD